MPRATQEIAYGYGLDFGYGAVTRYGRTFQTVFLSGAKSRRRRSYNPGGTRPPVWALPRSLAATKGISDLISFPTGTEMFQFPAFALTGL